MVAPDLHNCTFGSVTLDVDDKTVVIAFLPAGIGYKELVHLAQIWQEYCINKYSDWRHVILACRLPRLSVT